MRLTLTDDQSDILRAAGGFLAHTFPSSRLRELAADDGRSVDDATWSRVCDQGWLGVGLPGTVGGLGLGVVEEVLLFREVGRHLAPGPLLGGVLGARIALAAGDLDLAAAIVGGEVRVGMATGSFVIDAHDGDLAVRLDGDRGAALVSVHGVEARPPVDPGTRLGVAAEHRPVLSAPDGRHVVDVARTLAAAVHLGIIEAVRDMSAAYAVTREQFGKPIGSFQAVKHRCADMSIAAYGCRSQVLMAARCLDAGTDDASLQSACARVVAAHHARRSTADNVQNHGGIGFTWEHDAQLFVKRAHTVEHVVGPVRDAHATVLAGTPRP